MADSEEVTTAAPGGYQPSFDIEAALANAMGTNVPEAGILGASGLFSPPAPSGEDRPFQVGDAELILKRMTPREIAETQDTLMAAGVMRSPIERGRLDPTTVAGYEGVLELSNLQGVAPSSVLRNLSYQGLEMSKKEKQTRLDELAAAAAARTPFVAQVSNADELRSVFGDEVIRLTGENRGTINVDKMVKAYQAEQQNAQARSYNASRPGQPAAVVEGAPSAQAYAENAIAEAAPVETQSRNVVDRAGQLFDMLGTFGGR